MEKLTISTAFGRLKKSFWLLFSTIAALCLLLAPSFASLLLIAVAFGCVVAAISLNYAQIPRTGFAMRVIASVIAIMIQFADFRSFKTTWSPSEKVAALADLFDLSSSMLLTIVGLVGVVVGFYAMYVLSAWIIVYIKYLFTKLPEQKKANLLANLKRNWYFPISAMAFFCLNATLTVGYLLGILIAFGISVVISSQTKSIYAYIKENATALRIVSFLTAIGICWAEQATFYAYWSVSSQAQALEALLPFTLDIPGVISIIGAVVAVCFIYFCVSVFWKETARIISDNKIFQGIAKTEIVVYALLLIASVAFVVIVFAQSEAFYATEHAYDIIYTSDSPSLVKGNVYLALTHPENDLRQPLFALFAAPFVGIPYLISRLFGASATVQAMLINIAQVAMLFVANFLLAKMMKLNSSKRICFMILSFFTYTQLLFILMMEQYIVAYFWLLLCLYLINEKQQPDRISLWGAGGTLLTSMVLLPFMSEKSPFKDFMAWLSDMVKYGLEFIGIMLVFCRYDVIYNLSSKVSQLSGFTGKSITITDKFYQYTHFLSDCFVAPNAGVNTTAFDHVSWQLNAATAVNIVGIAVLCLAGLSTFLNRHKKSSLLAAGWVAFSAVMLFGLGWGTRENGLILYALYFGWAFLMLLFQLVEWVEDKLHTKILVPIISLGTAIAFAVINIPAIIEMINFAITYYPA